MQRWIDGCITATPTNDCHMNLLGDGSQLSSPFTGL